MLNICETFIFEEKNEWKKNIFYDLLSNKWIFFIFLVVSCRNIPWKHIFCSCMYFHAFYHNFQSAASRWLAKSRLVNNKITLKKSAIPKIIIWAKTITLIWYAKENGSPTKMKNIPNCDKHSDFYFHQLTICWTFIVEKIHDFDRFHTLQVVYCIKQQMSIFNTISRKETLIFL